jgi:hypothetical protein
VQVQRRVAVAQPARARPAAWMIAPSQACRLSRSPIGCGCRQTDNILALASGTIGIRPPFLTCT